MLVSQPYYNEPGFEREKGTEEGEARARQYNETVRLSVLESMVTVLKRPPAHFGDYVKAHFTQRKDTILRHVDRLLEGKGADPSTFQLSFIFTSHGYDLIFYDFIHNYFPILIYSILKIKQVRVRAHPHRP